MRLSGVFLSYMQYGHPLYSRVATIKLSYNSYRLPCVGLLTVRDTGTAVINTAKNQTETGRNGYQGPIFLGVYGLHHDIIYQKNIFSVRAEACRPAECSAQGPDGTGIYP